MGCARSRASFPDSLGHSRRNRFERGSRLQLGFQVGAFMPRKLPPKPDEKPQFERFIEAAKQVGAADTDADLSAVVRKIATKQEASLPRPSGKRGFS